MIVEKVRRKYDGIAILGSGIRLDGTLPPHAVEFVGEAEKLHRRGVADRLVSSGKHAISYRKYANMDPDASLPKITEAEAQRNELLRLGVLDEAIMLDPDPMDCPGGLWSLRDRIRPDKPNGMNSVLIFIVSYAARRVDRLAGEIFIPEIVGPDFTADVYPVARSFRTDEPHGQQEAILAKQLDLLGRHDVTQRFTEFDLYADPLYDEPITPGADAGTGEKLEARAALLVASGRNRMVA